MWWRRCDTSLWLRPSHHWNFKAYSHDLYEFFTTRQSLRKDRNQSHQTKTGSAGRRYKSAKPQPTSPLPAINFATFIFSLNSSALVQLGMMEDPMTGEKSKNLPLAKQTIDILSMLEEKTKGTWMPMKRRCSKHPVRSADSLRERDGVAIKSATHMASGFA
jgi:hypothetical protein